MRGVAAVAVMLHHFTQHTSMWIFQNAKLAVDLFFCLSGFVIAYSYQQRLEKGMSFRGFLFKRAIRLYPMFIMGFVIGVVALFLKIINGETNFTHHGSIAAATLNAFYIPYLGHEFIQFGKDKVIGVIFPTNPPAWSLFLEVIINASFAIWLLQKRIDKNPLTLAVLGGVLLVIYVILTGSSSPGWGTENILGGLPRSLYGFFAGVFLHSCLNGARRRLPSIRPTYLGLVLLLLFAIPQFAFSWLLWLGSTLLLVPVLVALGAVSHSDHPVSQKLSDYLGWLSYPIYCLHYPVYSVYTTMTGNADMHLWGAFLCGTVTISAAHLLAKYVDAPFRIRLTGYVIV